MCSSWCYVPVPSTSYLLHAVASTPPLSGSASHGGFASHGVNPGVSNSFPSQLHAGALPYSGSAGPAAQAVDVSNVSLGDLRSAMRRDLKFKCFGKDGKDRLDYLQAEKQIRCAERKGYDSTEIIDAVVEALPGGSEFRSVLLLKSGSLTVEELLDLLHSEYLEVDNSDLITQLTTAQQTAKEDEMTFLNRLIKLKERILYEGQVNISADALMVMVLKSLESGLANERIVTRLLPLFAQANVTDAILKQEMSKAMRSCTLRKDKKQQNVRVAAVSEESGRSLREDEFLKVAKELKEEVAEVKEVTRLAFVPQRAIPLHQAENQFLQNKRNQAQQQLQMQQQLEQQQQQQAQQQFLLNISNQPWFKKKVFGCQSCILAGTPTTCTHCLKCEKAGHKVKDCPEKENKAPASNSSRSLLRK